MHNWSYTPPSSPAIRYPSKQLGKIFRDTLAPTRDHAPTLRAFAEKFATGHKVELPFAVDPQGKLAEGINQDKIWPAVGINHTPTIYVVSTRPRASPFVEVVDAPAF